LISLRIFFVVSLLATTEAGILVGFLGLGFNKAFSKKLSNFLIASSLLVS